MNLCTAWNISVFRSYEHALVPCNNKSISMSILLLFGINICIESNKIDLKLLNLGQISKNGCYLLRERPFNLGEGLWFFSKKIFWFPMLLKKIFWFWWRKKKIIWFRVFVIWPNVEFWKKNSRLAWSFSTTTNKDVSSTKSWMSLFIIHNIININKEKEWSKTEPWGTPTLIPLRVEEKPSETTFYWRSER